MIDENTLNKFGNPPRTRKYTIKELIFKRNGYIVYWDIMLIFLALFTSFFVFNFFNLKESLLFSIPIIGVSMIIPLKYIKNAKKDRYLYKKGILTEGVITNKANEEKLFYKRDYIYYQFKDDEGVVYNSKVWLMYPMIMAKELVEDSPVTILYGKRNPRINTICEIAGFIEKEKETEKISYMNYNS